MHMNPKNIDTKRTDGWDKIYRLRAVANDADREVLDRLTLKAGIIWVCKNCGWGTGEDEETCGRRACRARR
jgi:hypothetical protein